MSVRNQLPADDRRRHRALRAIAAVAAVASCLALILDGAAFLADRPERVSGAHEAVAAQAIAAPAPSGAGADEGRSDQGEPQAGEASVIAVAGVFIDSGIEDDSVAAAMAALAIELASRSL